MPENSAAERQPFVSLLMLLILVLAGSVVFTIIGLAAVAAIYGVDDLMKGVSGGFSNQIGMTKILQIAATIGTFIAPAIMFAKFQRKSFPSYFKMYALPGLLLITLCITIVYVLQPFLGWVIELNQQMNLPGFLKEVETWMKAQEDLAAEMTKNFLAMDNLTGLTVNLILIAVLPAIGEELLFRGCLQNIFTRWTGNKHWGIWIAALLFSAIHLQFYGFVPRTLLGALFGYLFIWSNNLWIPILAHFVNNASAVITAYLYQKKGLPLDKMYGPEQTGWYYPVISFMITAALIWVFYTRSVRFKSIERVNGTGLG